jgi:hypothetical protein
MCIAMTSVKGSKQWYLGVAYFLNYKDDKKTARKKKRGVKTEVFILTTKPARSSIMVYKKSNYCYNVEGSKIKLLAK